MVREFAERVNSRVWFLKLRGENITLEKRTLLSLALRHRFGGRGAGSGTERIRRLVFSSLSRSYLRPAIQRPNSSGSGSEEEYMSAIVLSMKASKLMRVCEVEGFATIDDLIALSVADSVCPAICMTEGCDHIEPLESDQEEGYCERCSGNTMVSVLVLAELI